MLINYLGFERGGLYDRVARMKFSFFAVGLFAMVASVSAGPMELEPKEMAPAPTITESEPWHFTLASPGWLASVSGDIGLRGVTSNVEVYFDQILRHIEYVASLSAEARKGRFGVYSDLLYVEDAAALYNNGMLSKVNIGGTLYLVDGEAFYRVVECPRGWIDLRLGARYTDTYASTKLFGNSRLIDQAATQLANALAGDLRELLERLLQHRLDGTKPPLPVPPLTAEEKIRLLKLIIAARKDPITAQMKIAQILNRELNRSFSLTERWVDPYLGFDTRYDLNKAFYVTVRADVGGFDVGSKVSVQAYGGLGCHLTRSISSEIGFRYLYDDYESGSYLYRISLWGPQITTGITF
jgi:hypothetical protein